MMVSKQQPVSFRLSSSLSELDRLSDQLTAIGAAWSLEGKTILQINLALDEVFTNVVNYGIEDEPGQSVRFSFYHRGDSIEIVVCDNGRAFDPTRAAAPDLNLPLDEQPIGGLGIFLIRQYTDSISYKRDGDRNILTLTKKI